jgi:para-aminobenzoate synthetase/4-amino-4-deoxychorismate lyase
LCLAQGAQYSAYIDLGRFKVLCLSPELFFERHGDWVVTSPMKGTIHRGRWPAEDREVAEWLKQSVKDRAENVMIVDLLRNDLGKVSVPGSVRVSSLFDIERFETVWQMTSTVEATLKDGVSLVDLMSALFPCGSITGAPKIRTMQIIRELERSPRGAYTGTIGLLDPGGACVFNVAIRTVVVDGQSNQATFGVGGGVTIDSTAEREYEECLVKSRFLHTSPVEFQLIESMLLEDGEYFLLERHLERLARGAAFHQIGDARLAVAHDARRHDRMLDPDVAEPQGPAEDTEGIGVGVDAVDRDQVGAIPVAQAKVSDRRRQRERIEAHVAHLRLTVQLLTRAIDDLAADDAWNDEEAEDDVEEEQAHAHHEPHTGAPQPGNESD